LARFSGDEMMAIYQSIPIEAHRGLADLDELELVARGVESLKIPQGLIVRSQIEIRADGRAEN
jgi:hypothetical protein